MSRPGGGDPDRVEVKGWGEPLFDDSGILDRRDINADQHRHANNPRFRLEIVANLTAVLAGRGTPQRLTLRGPEVVAASKPAKYWVTLIAHADRAKEQTRQAAAAQHRTSGAPPQPD